MLDPVRVESAVSGGKARDQLASLCPFSSSRLWSSWAMRHRSLTQRLVTRAYASQVPLPPFYRPPPSPPPAADMSSSSSEPTLIDGLPIFERKNGKLDALYTVRARHSRPPPDLPELLSTFLSRLRGSQPTRCRTRVSTGIDTPAFDLCTQSSEVACDLHPWETVRRQASSAT